MIHSRLKEVAARHRVKSLQRLAEELGFSQATLYNFANDKKRSVDYDILEGLCRRFKCQPGDLLEFLDQGVQLPAESSSQQRSTGPEVFVDYNPPVIKAKASAKGARGGAGK